MILPRSLPTFHAAAAPAGVDPEPPILLLIWWRVCWWSPQGRADRAHRRDGRAVTLEVARLSQAGEAEVTEAVLQAFLALYRRYARGRQVKNVRLWATRYAITVMSARKVH